MDKRKNYYCTVDTETCGDIKTDSQLVYDIGWSIHDKRATAEIERSFIVYEIYCKEKDLMASAYYADKIPMYEKDIKSGKRKIARWATIEKIFRADCLDYNVKAIIAHNARFDNIAVNNTSRYITNGEKRFFYPYGIELWDSLKMASDTIGKQKTYRLFCETYGFMTNHRKPRPQLKAETLYRYITGDPDFIESHTGLEDVKIEREITAHCMKQHKKMRKLLYA